MPDKSANRHPQQNLQQLGRRQPIDVNQTLIFPHLPYSSEAQWGMALATTDESNLSDIDYACYFLYTNPTWPWQALDYSTIQPADKLDPGNTAANNFDPTPFHARGGKLIHHHDLADGSIATSSSIHFYNQVLRTLRPKGVEVDAFYRFFLVLGMQHCGGGGVRNAPLFFAGSGKQVGAGMLGPPGFGPPSTAPSIYSVPGYVDPQHDALVALVVWVENGMAPGQIVATKFVDDDPAL